MTTVMALIVATPMCYMTWKYAAWGDTRHLVALVVLFPLLFVAILVSLHL